MISAPGPRRERILGYGGPGAGKSQKWLSLAKWIKRTGSPSKIRLLDTDFAWEAYRPLDGSLDDVVIVEQAWDWEEFKPAMNRLLTTGTPTRDDVLVVDMIHKPWEKAQEGFFERMSGNDFDEFLFMALKNGENIGGDWGVNWGVINKMYNGFVDQLMRWRGHLIACAPETEVRQPDRSGKGGDSLEVRTLYGRVGMRPQGQKNLSHLFHTILYMQVKQTRNDTEWMMTTVKDRQRDMLKGEKVTDWTMNYLIQKAGWRP